MALIAFIPDMAFSQGEELLWYNKIGQEEGLSSQDYNFYVFVDTEGFAWIGSTTGLNRYDGHTVKQYRSNFRDSSALFGENIQSRFFEDRQHNLWFCTYEAVHCYDRQNDKFQHFFVQNQKGEPQQADYQVFCLEQDSMLWLRAGQQVYRININHPAQTAALFRSAKALFSTDYYHFFTGTAADGAVQYVFAGTNEKQTGLECFKIQAGKLIHRDTFFHKNGLQTPELGVFQVYFEHPEQVWLTTNKGLVKWNLIHPDRMQLFEFQFTGYSYLVPRDKGSFIVSFSSRGLFLFDKSTRQWAPYQLHPVKKAQHPVELSPRNLFLDRNDVLWITIPLEGVIFAHLRKRKFRSYPNPDDLRRKEFMFRNIMNMPDGSVWCSYTDGFLVLNKQGAQIKHIPLNTSQIAPRSINHAWADSSNGIWTATSRGLLLYNPSSQQFYMVPSSEKMDILYLYKLRDGPLLASTLHGNIFAIEKKSGGWALRSVLNTGGVPYTSIYEDHRKQIYICANEAGIDVFDYRGDTLFLKTSLPVRGAVNTCYEIPSESALWVGTSFGLTKINTGRLSEAPMVFTEKHGLPNNNVLGVVRDNRDKLWLSTATGLASFDLNTRTIHKYSMADGVLSKRFDKYAFLKLSDGSIWFGGSDGITIVPAAMTPAIKTPAEVLLTGMSINDHVTTRIPCVRTGATSLNRLQQIRLAHTENTLSFSFAAVDYAFPPGTEVAYQLAGMDKGWVHLEPGKAGFARYPNLPPGDYTFMVKGANSDGLWSDRQHQLQVSILPPYWQTWWFQGFLLLSGLLVVVAAMLYRINQIRKTEQLKRRIAENKMAALIAQMNPHFIFNSLQSINGYILGNNRKQASEYLGRFSRLIRMILEGSRNAMHSIEKEKDLLELYLKVESQRFKTPFQYEITIDTSLDTYEVQIPSMMLQPFVENAIWHGLSHKSDVGRIHISIENAGALLRCSVSDNGVGRKKALEIALQKGKTHESRALQILSERLELLFPGQQKQCSILYTDLYDQEGHPAGTKVEIKLPLVK